MGDCNINLTVEDAQPISFSVEEAQPIYLKITEEAPIQVKIGDAVITGSALDESMFWMSLARGFKDGTEPTLNASQPSSGEVLDYTYEDDGGGADVIRYRFVPDGSGHRQ